MIKLLILKNISGDFCSILHIFCVAVEVSQIISKINQTMSDVILWPKLCLEISYLIQSYLRATEF